MEAFKELREKKSPLPIEDQINREKFKKRFENYTKLGYGPAIKLDDDGRLKAMYNDVKKSMDNRLELSELTDRLDKLEDFTNELMTVASKRQIQQSSLPCDPKSLSKGKELAKGSFGKVNVATSDTGVPLVLKTAIGSQGEADLKTEVDVYAMIGHSDNIVKCFGMHQVEGQDVMVMEQVTGGGLDKVFVELNDLRNSGKISQQEYWGSMQHLFRGMLKGLAQMEKSGFVHNDLKGDNVLFDPKTGQAKLVDVGMATRIGAESKIGMELYGAPEKWNAIANGKNVDTVKSTMSQDMYSLGQMLFGQSEREMQLQKDGTTQSGSEELFAMGGDFKGKNRMMKGATLCEWVGEFMEKNENGEYVARALVPEKPGTEAGKTGKFAEGYESEYVKFLNALMHPDPEKRLTPEQALEHPFIKDSLLDEEGAKGSLQSMLQSPNVPPVDPQVALQKETDIRNRVAPMLKKDVKRWEKEIATAQKLDEKVLLEIESASKSLLLGKSTKDVFKDKELAKFKERVDELKKLETQLTNSAKQASDFTRDFSDLVPPSDKDVTDPRKYIKDCKNLETFARISRLLTTTHGQVTQTLGALEQLLESIEEQGNKGAGGQLAPDAPKTVRATAESIRNEMDKYFDLLEKDDKEFQSLHSKVDPLVKKSESLNDGSLKGGPAFPDGQIEAIKEMQTKLGNGLSKFTIKWDQIAKDIAKFEELTGATTRQEKGRGSKEKARVLATDDRNLLISLSALSRRIEWLKNNYNKDIERLEGTNQECIDGINRRIFSTEQQLRRAQVGEDTFRSLGDELTAFEKVVKSKFANPKVVKKANEVIAILRMRLKLQFDKLSKKDAPPEDNAKLLLKFGSATPPSSKGNSDSFFINGIDGKPAFILKPSNGESRFSDAWPDGGGAPREILMSGVGEILEKDLGIQVGIPKTVLATLEDPSFATGTKSKDTKRVGALQETFKIKDGDPPDIKRMFEYKKGETKEDIVTKLESINPKDVESVAIFDFLMLNGDRHAENMMVQNPGDTKGGTRLAPIDSGQCLPTPEAFRRGAGAMTSLHGYDPDDPKLNESDNLLMQLPSAQQKMSDEAQQSLKKLDPDAFVKQMKEQYEAMTKQSKEFEGKVDDSSFELVGRSAKFLKVACSELTLKEISEVYACGFFPIIDAKPGEVDKAIQQAVDDYLEYKKLGGADELLKKRVSVSNPPLELSERLLLLKKLQDPNVNPQVEQYKILLGSLGNIKSYIADSSDEDQKLADELYQQKDSLTEGGLNTKLGIAVNSFVAYKLLGGDPMIKNLLAGNDIAYVKYAKTRTVLEKSASMWLNELKEFFRVGGYAALKDLLGDSEYKKIEGGDATAHSKLLLELMKNPPSKSTKPEGSSTGTTTGTPPSDSTSSSGTDLSGDKTNEKNEEKGDKDDEKKRLAIGELSSSNPTLWYDDELFGERFRISTSMPKIDGDWSRLNQFCSLLSLRWLAKPSASFTFAKLSEKEQLEDAETLIDFSGLEDQVSHAVKQIGGTKKSSITKEELALLPEGAQIWFGSDQHAMAAIIQKDGQASFYDPDSGSSVNLTLDALVDELKRGNVYVVKG